MDLSPENILLDANFDIKVIDFGQACEFLHGYRHNVLREASMPRFGKDFYRAPELNMVNECKEWNPKMADIWSLGILLYVLLTGWNLLLLDITRLIALIIVRQPAIFNC